MKPKPFASLNHFTVPVAMTETFLRGIAPVAPAVMAVSSADIGGQTKTPRELGLARRVAQTSKHATEAAQIFGNMTNPGCTVNLIRAPRGGSRPPWSCGANPGPLIRWPKRGSLQVECARIAEHLGPMSTGSAKPSSLRVATATGWHRG